jgi:hypothetical protein
MASSIPGKQIFLLQVTLMHTGLSKLTIKRAPQEDASMLEIILWLGRVRNNFDFPLHWWGWVYCYGKLLYPISLDEETTMWLWIHLGYHYDHTSAINISMNPVQHSRTKHIDIRDHFLRDLVESQVVSLSFIPTDNQLADILTKPLDVRRIESLRKVIGVWYMS